MTETRQLDACLEPRGTTASTWAGVATETPPSPSHPALRGLWRAPANLLLLAIRLYQQTLSPALPVLFGPACGCRFSPTCSHYALEAVRTRGALIGVCLAAVRLVKCTPLHPGGFDPVPPKGPRDQRTKGPRDVLCVRVSRPSVL